MRENLVTTIIVEPRKIVGERPFYALIVEDPAPEFVWTYSVLGWQHYPIWWILAHGEKADPKEFTVLLDELQLKGYKCEFGQVIKETINAA